VGLRGLDWFSRAFYRNR